MTDGHVFLVIRLINFTIRLFYRKLEQLMGFHCYIVSSKQVKR